MADDQKQNGFAKRRENKKKDILAAARMLFFSSNFKDVTIAQIAKEAKASQVSIYNFFESKENLIRLSFMEYMNESYEKLKAVVDSDLTFSDKVQQIFDLNMISAKEVTADLYATFKWDDPIIKDFQQDYAVNKALPQIFRLLEQGRREGQISPDIDNQTILMYIQGFSQIISKPEVANHWDSRQREQLGQLFFYGLFGKPNGRG